MRCVIRSANRDVTMSLLHNTLDRWEPAVELPDDATAWCCLRVVLHEWVANLVQHADFLGRVPSVVITVWQSDRGLCGYVRDNSRGFDLDDHLHGSLEDIPKRLPDRGMGLLMMHDTAQMVTYVRSAPHRNTLYFQIAESPSLESRAA